MVKLVPYKDPEKARINKREYYIKNLKYNIEFKKARAIYDKQYNIKNRDKRSAYRRQYHRENKKHENNRNKQYNLEHKQQLSGYYKQYRIDNKKKIKAGIKKWEEANPIKVLQKQIKYLNKIGRVFNLNWWEFTRVLMVWAQTIRKRDKLCFCGKIAVHSHHIIHKSKYPQLAFNLNNGIALCLQHHNETHGKNLCLPSLKRLGR